MNAVFAAEGGYQAVRLGSSEWVWLGFAASTSLAAIGAGLMLMRAVLANDEGTPPMREVAAAIREGAEGPRRRDHLHQTTARHGHERVEGSIVASGATGVDLMAAPGSWPSVRGAT